MKIKPNRLKQRRDGGPLKKYNMEFANFKSHRTPKKPLNRKRTAQDSQRVVRIDEDVWEFLNFYKIVRSRQKNKQLNMSDTLKLVIGKQYINNFLNNENDVKVDIDINKLSSWTISELKSYVRIHKIQLKSYYKKDMIEGITRWYNGLTNCSNTDRIDHKGKSDEQIEVMMRQGECKGDKIKKENRVDQFSAGVKKNKQKNETQNLAFKGATFAGVLTGSIFNNTSTTKQNTRMNSIKLDPMRLIRSLSSQNKSPHLNLAQLSSPVKFPVLKRGLSQEEVANLPSTLTPTVGNISFNQLFSNDVNTRHIFGGTPESLSTFKFDNLNCEQLW